MNLKDLEKKTDGQLIGLVKNENMKPVSYTHLDVYKRQV